MRVEWSDEFDRWLDRLESADQKGDQLAALRLDYIAAQLQILTELEAPPTQETAQLKVVRQSGAYQVWRVSHRFDDKVALRLIVWFPSDSDVVVVTLFAGDKKAIGDAFYNSVATRADTAIRSWLMHNGHLIDEVNDTTEEDDDQD